MKIKVNIRKLKNQPIQNVRITAIKDDGTRHDKQFYVNGSKAKAKGQAALFLRNITQKAEVVELI